MIEYMHIVKYCISTFVTILLVGFLIVVIYIMRSIIKIPKGLYTWITNICTFILFLFVSVSLILGLVYFSPREFMEEDLSKTKFYYNTRVDQQDIDLMIKMELSTELSMFISKYALYPVVVSQMVIYISLSSHLLWRWYSKGEFDTIVNKIIFIQRILGIFNHIGWVVDYGIRLYGPSSFSFISTENYCACWIIFYKALFYGSMGMYFSTAFIRFIYVEYPIEYHKRYGLLLFLQNHWLGE